MQQKEKKKSYVPSMTVVAKQNDQYQNFTVKNGKQKEKIDANFRWCIPFQSNLVPH
jgi:hypothetical protein